MWNAVSQSNKKGREIHLPASLFFLFVLQGEPAGSPLDTIFN
jgi:hypothetical protein